MTASKRTEISGIGVKGISFDVYEILSSVVDKSKDGPDNCRFMMLT